MAVMVYTFRVVNGLSLLVLLVACLYELGILGNGHLFGFDPLRVLLVAGTIWVFTITIVLTYIHPWRVDELPSEDAVADPASAVASESARGRPGAP